VYFSLRKTSEVFALLRISKRTLKAYSFDMWNVIDLTAIILSVVSCLVNVNNPWLFAFTTASLWLRLLGLLKAINMELATFILAIIEVRIGQRFPARSTAHYHFFGSLIRFYPDRERHQVVSCCFRYIHIYVWRHDSHHHDEIRRQLLR
jgi:hypothetical protein